MKNLENLTIQEKIEYLRQNPIYWGKLGTVNDATLNGEESIEQYFEIEKQLCKNIDCDYEIKDNFVYSTNNRKALEDGMYLWL